MHAFVFPGQGSQAVGMGLELIREFSACRATFEEADEALGFSLSRICFTGPESDLRLTATAQPAILTASVAALRALSEAGLRPGVVAGHSLGEYSALVAAGALEFRDAVVLVHKRGLYMQEAVPVGQGAMAAIMGLEHEIVGQICSDVTNGEDWMVAPANLNAPGQTVVSGHSDAVDKVVALCRQRGARRAIRLQVSAPFHCGLMAPAARRLSTDLQDVTFSDLQVPLVANVDARAIRSGESARRSLIEQVTAPVDWEGSVRTLAAMGVVKALEVGPGKVLSGLIKQIEPRIVCAAAGDSASVAFAKEFLS